MLPSVLSQAVGTPENKFSRLHSQPIPAPVNACHNPLRGNSHDSGASAICYSFTARDFHPQLLADLYRRFGTPYSIFLPRPSGAGLALVQGAAKLRLECLEEAGAAQGAASPFVTA